MSGPTDTKEQTEAGSPARHPHDAPEPGWRGTRVTAPQIENTFTYHKPFGDQPERYQQIRSRAKALAYEIWRYCPESREKSLALTKVQEVMMWANASIAINEKEEAPG